MTTHPTVAVRPAAPNDSPAIAEIWHAGWRDGHLGHVPAARAAVRTASSFRMRAADRIGDTTIAEVGDEVAGFVMVVGDEVEQVYVAAPHRGSGVADALMSEAERRIREAGHAGAWLAVVPGNGRARAFYERRGLDRRGSVHLSVRKRGRPDRRTGAQVREGALSGQVVGWAGARQPGSVRYRIPA